MTSPDREPPSAEALEAAHDLLTMAAAFVLGLGVVLGFVGMIAAVAGI